MDEEMTMGEQINPGTILGFWFIDAWKLRNPPWLYDMWQFANEQ